MQVNIKVEISLQGVGITEQTKEDVERRLREQMKSNNALFVTNLETDVEDFMSDLLYDQPVSAFVDSITIE